MAKQKASEVNVVNNSDAVINESKASESALSGADVVSLVSCLESPRKFYLNSVNDYVEIPSAQSIEDTNGILRADGRSVLFTMKRNEWEELKALYSNSQAFENGLISECSDSEYKDKDKQAELAQQETGYEAAETDKKETKL